MPHTWRGLTALSPRSYVCGYCNHRVGPNQGFFTNELPQVFIFICSFCGKPTFFDVNGAQYPGVPLGSTVEHVPEEIASLYDEARRCASVGSHTSAVLTCRKILMHIAVQKGAPAGASFLTYVEYLSGQGYVPPGGRLWVDQIRKKGNEANHDISLMNQIDAQDLITFTEMLLKLIYEFPKKLITSSP